MEIWRFGMNKKNLLLFCLIILLFAIPSVLAGDVDDMVIANDNSDVLEITNQDIDEIQNDELLAEDGAKTFTDLNNAINGNSDSEVYLDNDYNYSSVSDSGFKSGITINRNMTVNGNGHTIDAKKSARIFQVNSSNVTFINITFLNGNIHKNASAYQTLGGGAISGKCTVINCTFIGNSADYAGAIKGGTGTIAINCTFKNNVATSSSGGALYEANAINCTFEGNVAKKSGGAIYRGSAENCNFTSNQANGTVDKDKDGGGAIYIGSAVNCIFTKNRSSYYGGAIYGGSATNCTFIENTATNYGGAISNGNAENCTFNKSNAKFGGAIYKGSALNCNFNDNSATGTYWTSGGAIDLPYMEAYVINCTFTNNRATYQGGALYHGSSDGNITVENCTFINNTAQNGGATYFTSAVNCTFIGNSVNRKESGTGNGGAMYGWSNSYYALNCTFINNTASDSGGAAYRDICEDCIFINNTAGNGGALSSGSAENCTFINNSANVAGGAIYDAVIDNCSFENNKVGDEINDFYLVPKFIIDDFRTKYNSGEKILATYTDSQGNVVDNVNISVNITKNGESIGVYYFLSGEGLLLNLDAGNYTGIFSIPDSSYGIPYREYRSIIIENAPTSLNASNINVVYTNNKYLVVTLTDSYGKPIGNADLSITFNGLKNLKTDAKGQVKISTKGLKPKTYSVLITYNGDNNYLKSTKSVKVVVKKAKPKITAKKKTFKKSLKVKKYKITLKYKKTAVKKVKVYIKIGKKTFKAKTNKKGKAVFKIKKFTKKGTFKAKITFKGNKYYKKVTKKVRIKIK